VEVNNSAEDYTFNGTGKLSGQASLTKDGTRKLTLAETGGSDFTNGVTISGGTLQVGNGSTGGNLGAGPVSLAASTELVFDHSDDVTVPNVISGFGTLTKNASDILTLGGTNSSFVGAIVVAQGTLKAGNPSALGTVAATVTINSAATLDVNGQKFANNQAITASGAGVGSNGAIVNNSTNSPNQILRNVTLADDTTFGGYSDWDIHSSGNPTSDATLSTSGNAYKLTKLGTNTVTIFGAQVDNALGDIDVKAGTLSFERNTTSMGDSSKTITVFTNATLQLANASNVWNKVVVLKDGATLRGVSGAEFAGPVSLESGTITFTAGSGALLTLDAAVTGTGGLTKNSSGTVSLLGANTYPGNALISAGTLALGPSGSIDNSSNITVAAGATLDVSGRSDQKLTSTSGQTLKGSGTVIGSVTVSSSSTLSPGGPGTNTVGALTVTSNLVLQAGSTTLMELNKAANTNDQVRGLLSVTYGGTLTVTGVGGAYAAGDIFKLFDAATYNASSFGTINLPVNVTWNTSQLDVDGTLRVVSVAPPSLSSIVPNVGGTFQLSFSGPAGNNYRVWQTTNLSDVPIAWTAVANGLFGDTGTATYVDTTATNAPVRFYRISVP
jgi:autotransporter-associated beta strand protein